MNFVPITDVCDFQGGTQPPKREWSSKSLPGYVRMLQIRDFTQSERTEAEYVKDTKKLKKCLSDDILIGRYGASVGKILTGLTGAYNVAIIRSIPDETKLSKTFLYYLLKGPGFQNFILNVGGRAAQAGFNKSDLEKFQIPLPSLDDQKRIAYLLGKVEGAIAQRKQHLQQLDDLLKSVFLEMFGDPVRNEKGWDKRQLSEFARVKIGPFGSLLHAEDYILGGIPSINPSHIVDGEIKIDNSSTITEEKFEELSQYRLALNDVIVARRGEIGRCALVKTDSKLLCGTGSMFVRITSEYSPILLQFMIFRTSLKSFLEGQAKGVTMKNLNSSILENMEVINPPTYLQKEFANIVEKVEGIKSRYQASLTDLENIYGALSQKAFKGELDLSRVPLPPDDTEATAAENPETNEPPQTTNTFDLPAPSELSTLNSAEGRHALLDHWLTVWLERRNGTPFSTQPFIDAAQQRLWELAEDDALELGAADYDAVRAWILASLEQRQNHRSQRLPQLTRRI